MLFMAIEDPETFRVFLLFKKTLGDFAIYLIPVNQSRLVAVLQQTNYCFIVGLAK